MITEFCECICRLTVAVLITYIISTISVAESGIKLSSTAILITIPINGKIQCSIRCSFCHLQKQTWWKINMSSAHLLTKNLESPLEYFGAKNLKLEKLQILHSMLWHWCAFSAFTLLVGQHKGHLASKIWVAGCWCGYLSGAKCRFAYAQLMPLLLTIICSSKSRLVLPFWYQLTLVVPDTVQGAVKWVVVVL